MTGARDIHLGPLVRSALVRDGNTGLTIWKTPGGNWQAAVRRPDGKSFVVDMNPDPVEAVYSVLMPLHVPARPPERRRDLFAKVDPLEAPKQDQD